MCVFRSTEADSQPSKKSKKSGEKGSVASLKELGCVFHDIEPPNSDPILRKGTQSPRSDRTVRFAQGTLHTR